MERRKIQSAGRENISPKTSIATIFSFFNNILFRKKKCEFFLLGTSLQEFKINDQNNNKTNRTFLLPIELPRKVSLMDTERYLEKSDD